jgi:hypothetical protein
MGMTPDQVRAAIKAYDPQMKISDHSTYQERPGIPASVAVIRACGAGPAKLPTTEGPCPEEIRVQFGQMTKVAYFIRRTAKTALYSGKEGTPFYQEKVIASLVEKYGSPTIPKAGKRPFETFDLEHYAFAADGTPYKQSVCPSPGRDDNEVINSTQPGCGLSLTLRAVPMAGDQNARNSMFGVYGIDHALLLKEIQVANAAKTAFDKNRTAQEGANAKASSGPKM